MRNKIKSLLKGKRKYLIIAVVFISAIIIATIISCFFVKCFDVEKLWTIAANVTISFGGLGLLYTIFQLYNDNKTMTKEMTLLEIKLCDELDLLKMIDYNFDETNLEQEFTSNIKASLQYIYKIDILSKKELISIEELSLLSGNKLKTLLIRIIKYGYDLLANKDGDAYPLILKYKENLTHVFNILIINDKDLNLLSDKVKSIEKAKPKNYIAANIISSTKTDRNNDNG